MLHIVSWGMGSLSALPLMAYALVPRLGCACACMRVCLCARAFVRVCVLLNVGICACMVVWWWCYEMHGCAMTGHRTLNDCMYVVHVATRMSIISHIIPLGKVPQITRHFRSPMNLAILRAVLLWPPTPSLLLV